VKSISCSKNMPIDSFLTHIVDGTRMNTDMCKVESSQNDESRTRPVATGSIRVPSKINFEHIIKTNLSCKIVFCPPKPLTSVYAGGKATEKGFLSMDRKPIALYLLA